MSIKLGLCGVFDDPDLLDFLNSYRMTRSIYFRDGDAHGRDAMLFAVDPANEASLEKTLNHIRQADMPFYWFAVLKSNDTRQISRAVNAGAQGVYFRNDWKPEAYLGEMLALAFLCQVTLWRYKAYENIRHRQEPCQEPREDMIRAALFEFTELQYLNEEAAFILPLCENELLLGEDLPNDLSAQDIHQIFEMAKSDGFVADVYTHEHETFFVGISRLFCRGPFEIYIVSYLRDDSVLPMIDEWTEPEEEAVRVEQLRELYRQRYQRIHRQIDERVSAYFKDVLANLFVAETSNLTGALMSLCETFTGVMDLYGSAPGESPYTLVELYNILKKRQDTAESFYKGLPGIIASLNAEQFDLEKPLDLHHLWHLSHENHFHFGRFNGPCGKLHYQGPTFPANTFLNLALCESFRLFRFIAAMNQQAANVTCQFKERDAYYEFRLKDKGPLVEQFQRTGWFQPFPLEDPSLMLYEAQYAIRTIGGNFDDVSHLERGEQSNALLIRCPKGPMPWAEWDNWTFIQQPLPKGKHQSLSAYSGSNDDEAFWSQMEWRFEE